ncbi:MAG: hypothetical protein OHK0053_24280 [Microscillaceae bacterium]
MAWLIKITEVLGDFSLASWGLLPRHLSGLSGILTAPFLHSDFAHLSFNSFPMVGLFWMVFGLYPQLAKGLTLWLFVATGFWTWCFAREAYHIGASGLVYGGAAFLLFGGVFRGNRQEVAISFIILVLYGGLWAGLFPPTSQISWEAHWSGFIAGGAYAYFSRRWDRGPSDSWPGLSNESPELVQLKAVRYEKAKKAKEAR